MSEPLVPEPLRLALVAEGITDFVVIRAAISAIVGERAFDLTLLQPEESVAFVGAGDAGILGGGWKGVWRWCEQNARNLPARDVLFQTYDLLILHLDADVGEDPNEREWPPGLPCHLPCPPASDKTDALRDIALGWLQMETAPPQLVFCTPSKSTEAWMVWLFCRGDRELNRYRETWECYTQPVNRLAQQPKKLRFVKKEADYQRRSAAIEKGWPELVESLSQAARFDAEVRARL